MYKRQFSHIVLLTLAVFIGAQTFVWAADDGFSAAREFKSLYFSVSIAPGVDEGQLVSSLNIGPEHKILAGQPVGGATFSSNNLGDLLDALFLWSCDVLDMRLYSYKGNIKIGKDEASLGEVYRRLYGKEGYSQKAFYIYDMNTLYISASDFTKEILGHEVAHAIISNFFVVQPPAKVQEVLAGYIEYQLRKTGPKR